MHIVSTRWKDYQREMLRRNPNWGWRNSSPYLSRTKREDRWISDEIYHDTLSTHNPLWRYIIDRYSEESDCPINIIGYGSVPMAIELSQWTYPITFIADNDAELRQAKRDAFVQAGFYCLKRTDYYSYIPPARVTAFTGLLNKFKKQKDLYRWLDMALKRCREIVCAVKRDRDWRRELGEKYKVNGLWYNYGRYLLLTIERR